jgi:signal transduction histidine kinase
MRPLRAMLEATAGRRLLLRIWMHGVLLFVGVIAIVLATRIVMSRQDALMAARTHPELAIGLAERALAMRDDPAGLAAELATLRDSTSVELGVFVASGSPVVPTAVSPATPSELAELAGPARYAHRLTQDDERFIVTQRGAVSPGAYAIAVIPRTASMWVRGTGLAIAALVLALVVVAIPLTRSIARPIERLRTLSLELGNGNLAARAPTDRRDEIGDLARSFNQMAAQIQKLRAAERELLADVSHELRTPLARMRVVLDLTSGAEPSDARRYLNEITTDLSELEQLIDHIIESSRLDAEGPWQAARPPLHTVVLDLAELVDAAARRFTARWPSRALVCDSRAPDLVVDVDPVMLRRAIDNLLDNARKYSAADSVIALAVSPAVLDRQRAVIVEVVDHGIGIAASDQPNVFTAFFRADKSRTRATGGVGLGLALTRRIVEAHRGTVGFSSELERGSRFWFTLPLAELTPEIASEHAVAELHDTTERTRTDEL